MSSIKRYNEETSQWEYIAIGKQGVRGPTGPEGPGVPSGGSEGQLLSKVNNIDYNSAWVNNFVPSGGTAGQVLVKTDATDYNIQWAVPVPSGVISPFAGGSVPIGYVLCDGQSLNTTTFANLFAVIGYTYGGSGSSFLVPNLKGRVPVGIDATQAEFNVRGEVGGAKTHTLTASQIPAHSHPNVLTGTTTFASSGHGHGPGSFHAAIGATNNNIAAIGYVAGYNSGGSGTSTYTITGNFVGSQNFNHYTPVYGGSGGPGAVASVGLSNRNNTGGGGAHNNLQPYMALNYIIKT
jgi:microcystin-dependent protein